MLSSQTTQNVFTDYITIKGKKFVDGNGNRFFPVALVYGLDIVYSHQNKKHYVSPSVYYGDNDITKNNICYLPVCKPPVIYEHCNCNLCYQDSLYNQILNDFLRIKSLGYNSLRLVFLSPRLKSCGRESNGCIDTLGGSVPNRKCFSICRYSVLACCTCQKDTLDMTGTDTTKVSINMLIQWYQNLLDLAEQAGLRVFLDVGSVDMGKNLGFELDTNAVITYGNYLAMVSAALKNKKSLIGFDLLGEPGNTEGLNGKKNMICYATQHWYNAVKNNSISTARPSGILVSYGLQAPDIDIAEWDYGSVAVDYLALHPYTFRKAGEPYYDLQRALEANYSNIKWYAENIHTPWMIGETNISGADSSDASSYATCIKTPMNTVDGTQQDQLNYILNIYQRVRDYGGMGITIWEYHDVYWSAPESTNPYKPAMCYQDGFGIIDRNNNEKKAAQAFKNLSYYAQPPYSPPSNIYYDYLGVSASMVNNHCVNGKILNAISNTPVKDAVIVGFTKDFKTPKELDTAKICVYDTTLSGLAETFSKSDGTFFLCNGLPPCYYLVDTTNNTYEDIFRIASLRISDIGNNVILDWAPANNKTYLLSASSIYQDLYLNNIIVPVNANYAPVPVTYNNINAIQWIIDGNGNTGGSAELIAGGEITLSEFEVRRGGELWAHYGLGQPNCNDNNFQKLVGHSSKNNTGAVYAPSASVHSIKLQPATSASIGSSENEWVSVYPNPVMNGKIYITVSNTKKFSEIIVCDVLGKTILQTKIQSNTTTLDIATEPKGVYLIKVIGQETIIKKVIN